MKLTKQNLIPNGDFLSDEIIKQILENQEKLEKIKEWIFHEELLIKEYLKENSDWAKCEDDCIAELKEILGDDMK